MIETPSFPEPVPAVEDHERSDVRIRPLAVFLGGLIVFLLVTAFIVRGLFDTLEKRAARSDPPPHRRAAEEMTPGPLLQVAPRSDMDLLRERENRELASTRWVDREAGIVQIPIERAMELVARNGLPEWPAVDAAAPEPSASDPAARGGDSGIETPPDDKQRREGSDP